MAIGSVSSNYITQLTRQQETRYDLVKNNPNLGTSLVYGNRQNQSYVNTDGVKYVQAIRDNAKSLYESTGLLSQKSTFERMSASSSDNSALKVNSSSKPTDAFQDLAVEIDQIATSQVNEGAALKSGDTYAGLGSQRFEIEVDGKKHSIDVQVQLGDTNKQVQQKMADAINSKNLGIGATVTTDSKTGASTLRVESKNTGDNAKNNFAIRDVSGSLVSKTGVGQVSQAAQDAVYRVNGEEFTSGTNSVDLGEGVTATLKGPTTEAATVSVKNDQSYAMDQVETLVAGYNKLLSASKTGTNGNTRLQNDLESLYKSYGSSLESLGISKGKDGSLTVDSKKLRAAADDGSLQSFFTQNNGLSYGFTNRLSRITGNVDRNPSYYVNSAENSQSFDVSSLYDETNTQNSIYDLIGSRSFNLQTYNQWSNLGFLFDMFV